MPIFIRENFSSLAICKSSCKLSMYKLAFKFLDFLEIPEILETHRHKEFTLQQNRKIKMLQIMVLSSDREIKG